MVRHSSFVLVCFKQHKMYFLLCSCSVVSIASELQSQQERLCKALSFSPCLSHYLLLLAHLDTKLWHIFNVMLLWLFCGSFPAGIPAVLACLAKAPDLQEVLIRLLPLLHSLPFSLSLHRNFWAILCWSWRVTTVWTSTALCLSLTRYKNKHVNRVKNLIDQLSS